MLVFENVVSDKIFNTRYPIKGILWFNSKSKKKIRRISNKCLLGGASVTGFGLNN